MTRKRKTPVLFFLIHLKVTKAQFITYSWIKSHISSHCLEIFLMLTSQMVTLIFVSLHTLLINTLYSIHYFSILLLAMFITLNLLPVSFNWHIQMHVIMMTLVLSSVSLYCKNQSLAACSMGAMYLFNILKVNTIMICFDPPLISILDSSVDSYRMKKSSKSPTSSSSSRHLVKPSNTDDLSGRRRGNCSLQFWQVHTSWRQAF